MRDKWDVKCREVYMDNSQKYQIWLNGVVVGEIVDIFDAVEKLKKIFDTIESLQHENEQLRAQVATDVEALRKAREALYHNMPYPAGTPEYHQCLDALAAIDKMLGG